MVQREGGSFCLGEEERETRLGGATHRPPHLPVQTALCPVCLEARRETTVLKVWLWIERESERERGGPVYGRDYSAKGGIGRREGARRRRRHGCCFSSLFPLSLSHTLFC